MVRNVLLATLIWVGFLTSGFSQQSLLVPYGDSRILVDGRADDWQGIPALLLETGRPGVDSENVSGPEDLKLEIRSTWDRKALYLLVEWEDDVWDIARVPRREAVVVTADGKRRDRMYFFDHFKFQFHRLDYDYLLWTSPRIADQGPFFWQRLLEGERNREAAVRTVVITPKEDGNRVTMEIMLEWSVLRLKPKDKKLTKEGMPLSLVVTDSDLPEAVLESKLPHLSWIEWEGRLILQPEP